MSKISYTTNVKDESGVNRFLTPLVTVTIGKDVINVNLEAGNDYALQINYVVKAIVDSAYDDATKRNAGHLIKAGIEATDKTAVYTVHMPKAIKDRDNYDVKLWTPVATVTHDNLLKAAVALDAVYTAFVALLGDESSKGKYTDSVNGLIVDVKEQPVYYTAKDSDGKAKRASNVKTFGGFTAKK